MKDYFLEVYHSSLTFFLFMTTTTKDTKDKKKYTRPIKKKEKQDKQMNKKESFLGSRQKKKRNRYKIDV